MRKMVLAALGATMLGGSANAATITFSNFPNGTNVSVTSYSEAGFTFTTVSGDFLSTPGFGAPAPSVYTTNNGVADVTGGLFTLASFQGGNGSFSGTPTFTITGFLGALPLYSATYTGGGAGSFPTFTNANPAIVVDRLRFALTGASANLDNIVVNTATPAVPEAATWAMMTLGFGAMGLAMRRKNVSTRIRFARVRPLSRAERRAVGYL